MEQEASTDLLPYIIIIVLGLLSLVLLFLFYRVNRRNDRLKNTLASKRNSIANLEFKVKELSGKLKSQSQNLSQLGRIEPKAEESVDDIPSPFKEWDLTEKKELENTVEADGEQVISNQGENEVKNIVHNSENSSSTKSEDRVYYMSFPDNENTFYLPEATPEPQNDSFYMIVNSELKLFDQIQEKEMKAALNFVDNHIKRACVIMNARESNHTQIRMVEPGKVVIEDTDVVVLEKMKVEYI